MSEEKKQLVGTEIDKSVGDVLRALLLKPATELGVLAGDGIGILADKVRAKRQRNLELSLQDARDQLEARGVEMKDITPLDEVDVHKVLSGMSLSSDEAIRKLWSGLLASALDPQCQQAIDRSVVATIEALNAQDAKIISFLVFAGIEEGASRDKAHGFYKRIQEVSKGKGPTEETQGALDDLKRQLMEVQTHHAQRIVALAKEYKILFPIHQPMNEVDWHLNLIRLGLIEVSSTSMASRIDGFRMSASDSAAARSFERIGEALRELAKRVPAKDDRVSLLVAGGWHVTLGVELSPFGRKFVKACGLFDQPTEYWLPPN